MPAMSHVPDNAPIINKMRMASVVWETECAMASLMAFHCTPRPADVACDEGRQSMAIWLAPYELSSPKAITSAASNKIRATTGTKDSPKEGMAAAAASCVCFDVFQASPAGFSAVFRCGFRRRRPDETVRSFMSTTLPAASDGYDLIALLQPFSEGLGFFCFLTCMDHEEVHDQNIRR